MNFLSLKKPHSFFLVVGFLAGMSFLILTPPFQVPDEINHFYREWHISSGHFFATKQDNRLGGYMPRSLIEAVNLDAGLRFNFFARTTFSNTSEQLRRKLNDNTPIFVDFPNTSLYTPLSYLPQALSIAIFKFLGFRPILILMLTRLTMLFLWLFIVYKVIKMLPIFKWFFVLSALLPMSSFVNMSVSADVITNMIGFLWIGFVFKYAFSENKIEKKNLITLLLLAICLATAKYVYTPLVLLILIIPIRKFTEIKFLKGYWLLSLFIFVPFVFAFVGSKYATKINIPYAAYNPTYVSNSELAPGVDFNKQIEFLKENPQKIFTVVYEGFLKTYELVQDSYIGTLGWLDVRIPKNTIYLGYLLLFCSLLYENCQARLKIKLWQRFLMLLTGVFVMFLIYLSQYISWVPVGNPHTYGVQGRYFITVLPIVFLSSVFIPSNQKLLLYFSMGAIVFVLLSSIKCLYNRYYFIPKKFKEVICDAETIYFDGVYNELCFRTNNPEIIATNGITFSSEKARSGNHSSKTSSDAKYGATFRLMNLTEGDTLKTEVWCFGEGGKLWVTSNEDKVYLLKNNFSETDAKGWKRLALDLVITKNMASHLVNIYVESDQICFFDDFKFSVQTPR